MNQKHELNVKAFLSTEFSGATRFAFLDTAGNVEFLSAELLELFRDSYKVFARVGGYVEVDAAGPGVDGMLIIEGDPEIYGETCDILMSLSGETDVVNQVLDGVVTALCES